MPRSRRERRLSLATYYQKALQELEQRYAGATISTQEIRAEFQQDWQQIERVHDWCAANAEQDVGAAVLCSKFAGVAGTLLENQLSRPLHIDWLEAAVDASHRVLQTATVPDGLRQELSRDLVSHLAHLGYAYLMIQNTARARELCERARAFAREQGHAVADAAALSHLAMVAMNEGKLDDARSLLRQALGTAVEFNELRTQAGTLATLGIVSARSGSHPEALELYDRAIKLFEQAPDLSALCTTLVNRSVELLSLGKTDEAERDLKRAKAIAEEVGSEGLRGLALANMARLYRQDTDPKRRHEAVQLLEDARAAFERAGDGLNLASVLTALEAIYRTALECERDKLSYEQHSHALRRLAEIHGRKNEHEEAGDVYERLLRLAQTADNPADQLEALGHLGHGAVRRTRYEEAIDYHEQGLMVLAGLRQKEERYANEKAECEICLSMGQAYSHLAQPREAARWYERALEIASARGDKDAESRARGNFALIQIDLKEYDAAISELKKVVEAYRFVSDIRLMAHALFNLAYAHHRRGDNATARAHGEEARRLLERFDDPMTEDVRRQLKTWPL